MNLSTMRTPLEDFQFSSYTVHPQHFFLLKYFPLLSFCYYSSFCDQIFPLKKLYSLRTLDYLKSRKVSKVLKLPLLSFLYRLLHSSGFASTANKAPCLPDFSAYDQDWCLWHACSINPPQSVQHHIFSF